MLSMETNKSLNGVPVKLNKSWNTTTSTTVKAAHQKDGSPKTRRYTEGSKNFIITKQGKRRPQGRRNHPSVRKTDTSKAPEQIQLRPHK